MTISNCPDELVLSVYADGEISGEQAAELRAHVAGCPSCSARVAALGVENSLLRELIEEPPLPAARPAGSRIELAACVAFTLGAIALMGAGLGLLERLQLPAGFGWLNPLAGRSLVALLSAVGVWVVQGGPAFWEALLSFGATMALASLVGFGLAAWVARGTRALAAGLVLCALAPGTAAAVEIRGEQGEVRIAGGETIEDSLIVGAELFELDGDVQGDLAVAAELIRLRGHVQGNVFAAARIVELGPDARIEGSLFSAGETLEIGGAVRDSSYFAANRLELAETSRIGRNVLAAGNLLELNGQVGRDASLVGERARLGGRVERDLTVLGANTSVLDSAVIGRDLEAWLGAEDEIQVAEGAQVLGETRRRSIDTAPPSRFGRYGEVSFYVWKLVSLAAALVVGMLVLTLIPALAYVSIESARSFFVSAGIGLLALIAAPIAAVIAAITLVGIPLALILLGVYIVFLYLAQLPVAAWIGSALLGEPDEPTAIELVRPLGLGLVLIYIASNLPYIGTPIALLTMLLGLGLLLQKGHQAWRSRYEG